MRILIADDHPLMVDGLCSLLEAHGFDVVGTVGDGQEAVSKAISLKPDLVLMDIRMPVQDGLTATRLIKAHQPDTKILIITTSAEDEDLFEAIKSGAYGYLLKDTRGPALVEALHGLEQGVPPFSPGLAERLLREFARQAGHGVLDLQKREKENTEALQALSTKLTERQIEVLRLVSSGLTYKKVGSTLGLSEVTIRYHMSEIIRRLHLENRAQVIAYAGKLGLEDFKEQP